jgi:TRAP-type transport system periplasmic protein
MTVKRVLFIVFIALIPGRLWADYKPEFKLSLNVNAETSWGRAAQRFADTVRYRTGGRIRITCFFDAQLFKGEQLSEFELLRKGSADFSVGSTINWSPQVKELNLFAMPFLISTYAQVDAVQAGPPGERIFAMIEQNGVIPLAWGENGFRELTNAHRPIRRPEDLGGLRIRTVGVPIFRETFQALGAIPTSMNWDEAQKAFRDATVDGQENPVALIVPYKLYLAHNHITLWRYTIDPLILAASANTWTALTPDDRVIVRRAAETVMAEQKKEAREGLEDAMTAMDVLHKVYGMEVTKLSDEEVQAFRDKTEPVYARWAVQIGTELVRSAEAIVGNVK